MIIAMILISFITTKELKENRPSMKDLSYFSPFVPMYTMSIHQGQFLFQSPGILLYVRIKMIVPPENI